MEFRSCEFFEELQGCFFYIDGDFNIFLAIVVHGHI